MNDTTPTQNAYFVRLALRKFKPAKGNVDELQNISLYLRNAGRSNDLQIKERTDLIEARVGILRHPDIPDLLSNSHGDVNLAYEEACAAADELFNLVSDIAND